MYLMSTYVNITYLLLVFIPVREHYILVISFYLRVCILHTLLFLVFIHAYTSSMICYGIMSFRANGCIVYGGSVY